MAMKIEITLDDLSEAGINAVLQRRFDMPAARFTRDWAVTGPLIEKWGLCLDFQAGEPSEMSRKIAALAELEHCPWSASAKIDGKNIFESGVTPLMAASLALARATADGDSVSLSLDRVAEYVKSDEVLLDAVLLDSDGHVVEAVAGEPETFSLEPIPGRPALDNFQRVVELARVIPSLRVIKMHRESETGLDLVDSLIVQRIR